MQSSLTSNVGITTSKSKLNIPGVCLACRDIGDVKIPLFSAGVFEGFSGTRSDLNL